MEHDSPLHQILERIDRLDSRMEKIERYLDRQKGFIGGIMLVAGIVAWVIAEVKDWWK